MKSDSLDFVSGVSDQDLNGFEYENLMPAANSVVRPQISVKGNLLKSIDYWRSLGAPDFILNIIRDGYKIPFISTPPPRQFRNNASAFKESDFVGEAISELLSDNRVEEIFSAPDILNPLTVSIQRSGKKRLILDLRHINLHVFKQKFKCEGLHTIKDVFFEGYFVFSFDLKSGYHHVDIFPEHRRFLAFSWRFGTSQARYFQFTVLPFGLSSAPFVFTKLLKPLETHWRAQGIPIAIFFYDGVGDGLTLEAAKANSSSVRSDLVRCGFGLNHEKSIWQPSTSFSWIGFNIDTQTGFIFAVDSRIDKLCSDLNSVCASLVVSPYVYVKKIASIVGQIISLAPSCGNVTQIMTRFLHFVINSRRSWNCHVLVLDQAKEELVFWRDNLKSFNGKLFWPVPFFCSVQSFVFGCFFHRLCRFYSGF